MPASPQLIIVFAPGLWPFRLQIDYASWLLAKGIARTLSTVPTLAASPTEASFTDPRALAPGQTTPPRVRRELPPQELVVHEAKALGARWVLTSRLLVDKQGLELWLNLLDGTDGDLLWTRAVQSGPSRFLWEVLPLLEALVTEGLGETLDQGLKRSVLSPTGSWPAFTAYAAAEARFRRWTDDVTEGAALLGQLAQALNFDPQHTWAAELIKEVADRVLRNPRPKPEIQQLLQGLPGRSPASEVREVRRRLKRILTFGM